MYSSPSCSSSSVIRSSSWTDTQMFGQLTQQHVISSVVPIIVPAICRYYAWRRNDGGNWWFSMRVTVYHSQNTCGMLRRIMVEHHAWPTPRATLRGAHLAATLLESWEQMLAGRCCDGEGELLLAASRVEVLIITCRLVLCAWPEPAMR